MTGQGDTWVKAHDNYLETLFHRVRLLAQRSAGLGSDTRGRHVDASGSAVDPVPTPTELADAIARHERHLRELETELSDLGSPPPLTLLTESAGLSSLEAETLGVALAYELDVAVGTLLESIPGTGPQSITPSIAAELFGVTHSDAIRLHDPASPLQRFRLAMSGDQRLPAIQRTIRLEPRTLHYLRGHNQPDEALAGILEPLVAAPLIGPHQEIANRLVAWTSSDAHNRPTRVNLIGPPGQGRAEVAAAVAHSLGLHAMRVDVDRMVARPERLDLVRLLVREALLLPAALYVDAPEIAGDDPTRATAVAEIIADLEGLVFIASRDRWDARDSAVAVAIPQLDSADRAGLWRNTLDELAADVDIDRVAEQFALGPGGVKRVVEEIRGIGEINSTDAVTTTDVWAACRSFVGAELGSLAQRIDPVATWDRLVLPDRELGLLRKLSGQVDHRTQVYDEWGLGAILNRGRGISALFTGPPGTGKTMAAEIIAGELELELYRIDLSSVISKYIGETEKNLRKVFDAADQGGAILFFDEADALFGKRTEVKDSHDRHANVEINYLLQRMEDYAGLAILATNRKGDLDPAFLRRIRFVVSFPFPRPEYRSRIWETVLPKALPRLPLDLAALARLEIAGGSIRNVAVNAAFEAAASGDVLSMNHLVDAAAHEYAKLDKLPTRSDFGDFYDAVRP